MPDHSMSLSDSISQYVEQGSLHTTNTFCKFSYALVIVKGIPPGHSGQ